MTHFLNLKSGKPELHQRIADRLGRRWLGFDSRWLIVVLILATVLRLYQIGQRSLWFDEAISALSVRFNWQLILSQRIDPLAPPLYYLLLHFWMLALAGIGAPSNEVVLRSFSAVWSVAAIGPVYALGQHMFNRKTGIVAALLMALLPFQITYAQEARSYSLVIFCSAFMLWALVRALDYDRGRDWLSVFVISALGLYINYILALPLIVFHIYALFLPTRWRLVRRLLLVDAALAMSLLPLVPDLLQQSQQLSAAAYKLARPTLLTPLVTFTFLQFGYVTESIILTGFALFVTLAILILLMLPVIRQVSRRRMDGRTLLLLEILLPPFIMVVLSFLIQPVYYDRWFAFITPALAIFVAQGISARPTGLYRVLLLALFGLTIIRLTGYYTQPDQSRPPFREASAYIVAHAQPGDVVLHLHDSTYPSFRFYAPEIQACLWQDDVAGWLVPAAWKWFGARCSDLSVLFEGHARIWVMSLPDTLDDSRRALESQIEARYPKVGEMRFDNVAVALYAAAPKK